MGNAELKRVIEDCVLKVCVEDRELFTVAEGKGIYEPTISHRLAHYLENSNNFNDYNVDCEYSKHFDDPKLGQDGKGVRPDIVIHRRGDDMCNLVCIEVKKNQTSTEDFDKLAFWTSPLEYNYKLGVSINFKRGKNPKLDYFENGVLSEVKISTVDAMRT